MALTAAHIESALASIGARGKQIKSYAELADGANKALAMAPSGLTAQGAAAFLATMAQESAYFRTTTEYGTGQRYAPYVGRTFEQVTWKANYATFGQWCKNKGLVSDADKFVKDPKSLSDYEWAWLGGVWYFEHAGLWKYANKGDFLAVSQGVNGGVGRIGSTWKPNGWDHRKAMYDVFVKLGSVLLPERPSFGGGVTNVVKPPVKPAVNKPPLIPQIKVDGVWGPATEQRFLAVLKASKRAYAVQWVQRKLNELGYRDKFGRKLYPDGQGLPSNVKGRTEATHTIYAFSKAMSIPNPSGRFDRPSDAVKQLQRNLNKGKVL